MKVLFATYYYYFQKELYSVLVDELKASDTQFRLLITHNKYGRNETLKNMPRVHLLGEVSESTSNNIIFRAFNRIKKSTVYFLDRWILNITLRRWTPDIVIINNDLAGIYIRMLQDLCEVLDIPVLIVVTTNFVTFDPEPQPTLSGIRLLYSKLLCLFKYYNAYYFNGNTIGTYLPNSMIAVQGEKIKEILITKGIKPERIVVTGNPLFDKYFALRNNSRKDAITTINLINNISISEEQYLIVYCTEVIEYIYGNEYLHDVNHSLKNSFDDLPENIKVAVKLHPAETAVVKQYYKNMFLGERYVIIENTDLGNLFKAASVMVAHFSATIMEAIAVGTPVLMIDFNKDEFRHQYIPYDEMVVAIDIEEFKEKLSKLIFDQSYIEMAMGILNRWLSSYFDHLDSLSAGRVVSLMRCIVTKRIMKK